MKKLRILSYTWFNFESFILQDGLSLETEETCYLRDEAGKTDLALHKIPSHGLS